MAYLFFDPHDNTVLACKKVYHTSFQWPIPPNLFKITTELLLMMDRKLCMRFHLAPLSLTLSDFERSIYNEAFFPFLFGLAFRTKGCKYDVRFYI